MSNVCWLGFKLDMTSCQIAPTFLMGGKVSGSWKVERSIKYMIASMMDDWSVELKECCCQRRKWRDFLLTFSRFISQSREVWVVAKYSITPHFLRWSAAASNSFQSKLRITKASSGVVFCKVKFTKTPSSEYKESDKYSKSVKKSSFLRETLEQKSKIWMCNNNIHFLLNFKI